MLTSYILLFSFLIYIFVAVSEGSYTSLNSTSKNVNIIQYKTNNKPMYINYNKMEIIIQTKINVVKCHIILLIHLNILYDIINNNIMYNLYTDYTHIRSKMLPKDFQNKPKIDHIRKNTVSPPQPTQSNQFNKYVTNYMA